MSFLCSSKRNIIILLSIDNQYPKADMKNIYPMNSSNGNIATLLLLVLSLLVCSAEEDCVAIGDLCNPGSPDFDPQGAVCGNDGQPNEAYCNYSVGPNACVIGCKMGFGEPEEIGEIDDDFAEIDDDFFGDDDLVVNDDYVFDPEFLECIDSHDELLENNPELAELDDSLATHMESEEYMTITPTENSFKTLTNIPQDWQDSMSEACADAGGVLDQMDTLVCVFEGIELSYVGMASCLPDTDSCKTMANGNWYVSIMEIVGIECQIGEQDAPTTTPTDHSISTEFPTPAEVGLGLDQEEESLTTSASLNCLYGGGEFAPTSISVESLGMSGDVSCASFCWDCADSDEDDTLCTDEQRANGAKISQFLAVPADSLEMYASVYANYNFQSCMIDVCNSADPCGGTVGGATESPVDAGTESNVVDENEIKEDECSAEPSVFVKGFNACVDGRVFFDNCPFDGAAALVARQTPEGVMACCPPGVTKGSVIDADEGELPFTCGSVEGDESNVQASPQDEDNEDESSNNNASLDQEEDSTTNAPTSAIVFCPGRPDYCNCNTDCTIPTLCSCDEAKECCKDEDDVSQQDYEEDSGACEMNDDCLRYDSFCGIDGVCHRLTCENFYEFGNRTFTGYNEIDPVPLECRPIDLTSYEDFYTYTSPNYQCGNISALSPDPTSYVSLGYNRQCTAPNLGDAMTQFDCFSIDPSTDFTSFLQRTESFDCSPSNELPFFSYSAFFQIEDDTQYAIDRQKLHFDTYEFDPKAAVQGTIFTRLYEFSSEPYDDDIQDYLDFLGDMLSGASLLSVLGAANLLWTFAVIAAIFV